MANRLQDLQDQAERMFAEAAAGEGALGPERQAAHPDAGRTQQDDAHDESRWPVEAADIHIVDPNAPVALTTLGDPDLAARVASAPPDGLAAAGPTATENIGIEKLVRNMACNPNVSVLVVAGPETGGSAPTGHYAGDALVCLHRNGIDAGSRRIRGARGRRPLLKNLDSSEIARFRGAVRLVDLRGERDPGVLAEIISKTAAEAEASSGRGNAPAGGRRGLQSADLEPHVAHVEADDASPYGSPYRPDPAGYFLVFVEHAEQRLVLEHYGPDDVRKLVLTGATPEALAAAAVHRNLLSRLDHAAYLGRELERAARALEEGTLYVQDSGGAP